MSSIAPLDCCCLENKLKIELTAFRFGIVLLIVQLLGWFWGLYGVERDIHQGDVYRIIYVHVPTCLTAFACAFYLFLCSIYALYKKNTTSLLWGQASAELGLLFTVLGLVTGSIWGRVTWGVWWTWDARLLTTFILGVLFAAYLLLQSALPSGIGKVKASAALGLLIFVDVPIIYKSVTWWRTLHQPPSIGTGTMSSEIITLLLITIAASLLFMTWLLFARVKNLQLRYRANELVSRIQ